MTSRDQLDRLLKLRHQRTQLAEQALAHARRQCQEIDERSRDLSAALDLHRRRAEEHDQHMFETARQPLNASQLEQWQDARADENERLADLECQQRICHDEARLAVQKRETRTREWSQRLRAQEALERLQALRQETSSTHEEYLAELEMEESHTGRGLQQ